MNRMGKRALIGAILAGTLGLATSAMAQNGYRRDMRNHRIDLRHDFRDVQRDHVNINHDRRELRRDQRQGYYRAAVRERRDFGPATRSPFRSARHPARPA